MSSKPDIDSPYPITQAHIDQFNEQGYIKLKEVLSPEAINYYRGEITSKVIELNTNTVPLEQRSTYGKAFLQIMNLWRESELVKEFVMSKRLGRLAAELMGVSGVRVYHDQALYKEPGGGITPWHADQYYWPLNSDRTVTAWIPLLALDMSMGPLEFSPGTQRMKFGRELEIGDESEKKLSEVLKDNPIDRGPFDLGEVSFHLGWTFHRAGANTSTVPREVMTIIYIDEDIRVSEPVNKNQRADLEGWMPGAKVGEIPDTRLNPVIWSGKTAA